MGSGGCDVCFANLLRSASEVEFAPAEKEYIRSVGEGLAPPAFYKQQTPTRVASRRRIVLACQLSAAAEDENEGDDYKPNVSIIEKVAKAVVHNKFSF